MFLSTISLRWWAWRLNYTCSWSWHSMDATVDTRSNASGRKLLVSGRLECTGTVKQRLDCSGSWNRPHLRRHTRRSTSSLDARLRIIHWNLRPVISRNVTSRSFSTKWLYEHFQRPHGWSNSDITSAVCHSLTKTHSRKCNQNKKIKTDFHNTSLEWRKLHKISLIIWPLHVNSTVSVTKSDRQNPDT
jgi:hypothetical protein